MVRKYLVILLLLGLNAMAQQEDFTAPDSLKEKDFGYFEKHISLKQEHRVISVVYARTWIEKAKREKDFTQLAAAYKSMLYLADKSQDLKYADSILLAAGKTGDNALNGSAYLTKGTIYYGHKQHVKALDNFLVADDYISRTQDRYLAFKVRFAIAQTKYYLGFYDESIAILRESRRFQLAVEHSGVTGFIHRFCPRVENATACTARWKITPLPTTAIDDLPGVGHSNWEVQLLKVKNGRPASWNITFSGGRFLENFEKQTAIQTNHERNAG